MTQNVLHKHCGVIERMKKRIGKEEQGLQQCELRIQDQDNLIRQAVSEFMSTDRKQTPEVSLVAPHGADSFVEHRADNFLENSG